MEISCIAIDDEPPALALIKTYAEKIPSLKLIEVYDDAIAAREYLKASPVDLIFVDINMPDINGLDLVRSLDPKPMVIFTTAYRKFALEGFELDAIDYLLKPISIERFTKATNKAVEYFEYRNKLKNEEPKFLFVYSEYRMVKVDLEKVEYIESLEDYIRIHFLHDKPILTLMPLKKVLEKLPPQKFKRIHRSYIVSVDKVKSIHHRKVKLSSSAELPISDSYASFVNEWKANG